MQDIVRRVFGESTAENKLQTDGLTRKRSNQPWFSAPEFVDVRQLNNSFVHLAAISGASFNITSGGIPERVEGAQVSASFFSLLGTQAQLGRIFSQGEDQPGHERVVILSDGLWKRRFGGDGNLIGRNLVLNGQSYSVVGILPVEFQFPGDAEMWTPLVFARYQQKSSRLLAL